MNPMRYLVLTDIHANLEALQACLTDAGTRGYDKVLVLGDIVGYGADPNPVVARIQALQPAAIIRGNHDKVALGLEQAANFRAAAWSAAQWTLATLAPEHQAWLAELPQGPRVVDELIEIAHGSPVDEDAYILDELDALSAIGRSVRPLCLFGHTHHPVVFELVGADLQQVRLSNGETSLPLRDDARYLANPGAVGQSRDGDPRAAYAIVDERQKRLELIRVGYPLEIAQGKIIAAGLPDVLAKRLAVGR